MASDTVCDTIKEKMVLLLSIRSVSAALRGCVLAAHVIVLHDNEAICIVLISAELDVSPLHGDQLAAAKTRT